jgi:hypothetical protein
VAEEALHDPAVIPPPLSLFISLPLSPPLYLSISLPPSLSLSPVSEGGWGGHVPAAAQTHTLAFPHSLPPSFSLLHTHTPRATFPRVSLRPLLHTLSHTQINTSSYSTNNQSLTPHRHALLSSLSSVTLPRLNPRRDYHQPSLFSLSPSPRGQWGSSLLPIRSLSLPPSLSLLFHSPSPLSLTSSYSSRNAPAP